MHRRWKTERRAASSAEDQRRRDLCKLLHLRAAESINMDAKTYLQQIIEPTIREYANERPSVRRAYIACVVTYHMIDHWADGERPEGLRAEIRSQCPSFLIVERVAHAFKHVKTGHPENIVKPLTDKDVITRPPATYGTGAWGLSRYGDDFGGVTLDGARHVDLLAELGLVQHYFQQRIAPQEYPLPTPTATT